MPRGSDPEHYEKKVVFSTFRYQLWRNLLSVDMWVVRAMGKNRLRVEGERRNTLAESSGDGAVSHVYIYHHKLSGFTHAYKQRDRASEAQRKMLPQVTGEYQNTQ